MTSKHIALGKDGKVLFFGSYIKPVEGGISIHFTEGGRRGTYINNVLTFPDGGTHDVEVLWEGEVPSDVLWRPHLNWLPHYLNAAKWIEDEISNTRT